MSKPIRRSPPCGALAATMPTTPPAGPDRIASLPRNALASVEAAVRLHELQLGVLGQPGRDPVDVAAQDRRQIGVDHRRVAAPDQLDQRRDLVADRDLREAELARDLGQPRLMLGEAPAVHQDDRQRVDPCSRRLAQARRGRCSSSSGRTTSPSAPTRSSISTTAS